MVAKLKLKAIDGRAPPGVEPPEEVFTMNDPTEDYLHLITCLMLIDK